MTKARSEADPSPTSIAANLAVDLAPLHLGAWQGLTYDLPKVQRADPEADPNRRWAMSAARRDRSGSPALIDKAAMAASREGSCCPFLRRLACPPALTFSLLRKAAALG